MFGSHPVGSRYSRSRMTTAATQKTLADEWRAPTTAPVTVRDRSPGPILRDMLRRSHSSASQAPADHRVAVGVNRDASLFCRAPGSDPVARHGGVAPPDHSGSAGRRTGPRGAGRAERSPRHNKSGHGRSSCRSAPGPGSRRIETAALMPRRRDRNRDRHMDDRHDCRDTVPACVPSTVWGTASMRNRQVEIGAVLAPR